MDDLCRGTGSVDHCRLYMAARRRAMEGLYRYAMESEIAHYHLMMCMRSRDWTPMPSRRPDPRATPFPEDIDLPPAAPVFGRPW
jgi:hypothetical protein